MLKREKVLLRLYPGDEIVFRVKGEKRARVSYVNNLSDTSVVTHRDTIPFHRFERLYFRQHRLYNTVGTALVIFGVGLFAIDQLNVVVVNGQTPELDDNVTWLSASSVAAGLPMMLLRKKSQKIRYPTRLRMVDQGSGFYRPDLRQRIE